MNSLVHLLLFSLLFFSLTLSIQGGCTTCGGTVPRTVTLVSGTGTAFPCWLQNTNDQLPKCYLCSAGTNGTHLSDLLGPAGNIASCNGTSCSYQSSTYTNAATLHPCWTASSPCSDPSSCSHAQHITWSWPNPVDVPCTCSGRREGTPGVGERQIDPKLCPWGSIAPLTIPCQNISHSTTCPANSLNRLTALSNPAGGNCALCDAKTRCFSNASTYQLTNNTCASVTAYGATVSRDIDGALDESSLESRAVQSLQYSVTSGVNVPCMGCHGILLTNGTTICGTHVSANDYCYCNVLSLSSCSNVTITGQTTQKICAVWDMDSAITVSCIVGSSGNVHIASLNDCLTGNAYSPTNCDAHQCSGGTCN